MNYLDEVAVAIQRIADPKGTDEDLPLYRVYAVLALAKGECVTAEDVHNAWVAFTAERRPGHRCLVPFEELSITVQLLDDPFADAIRQVAQQGMTA